MFNNDFTFDWNLQDVLKNYSYAPPNVQPPPLNWFGAWNFGQRIPNQGNAGMPISSNIQNFVINAQNNSPPVKLNQNQNQNYFWQAPQTYNFNTNSLLGRWY